MQRAALHSAGGFAGDETPDAHVEAVVRAAGSSFFWGMRRLPSARRRAIYAIYAFCREVDDIVDGDADPAEKRIRLDQWRTEVDRLFDGTPRHPVAQALRPPVASYGLQRADFHAIIDGMEMDSGTRVRIADMAELDLYCDRVASAVGRLSVRVFGMPEAEGDQLAFFLGRALQLTNILRDLAEDADRDRLYLPADLLHAHGLPTDDPAAVLRSPALRPLCERLAGLAAQRFEEAASIIRRSDRAQVRPAAMMMAVYRRLLDDLVADGWHDPARPVRLPRWRKLWLAFRHGVL